MNENKPIDQTKFAFEEPIFEDQNVVLPQVEPDPEEVEKKTPRQT